MDERSAGVGTAVIGPEREACWPLLAAYIAECAERLALASVVATADPAEGLAAAWRGLTLVARTGQALACASALDAIVWADAGRHASGLARALLDAPSLPAAERLCLGRAARGCFGPGVACPAVPGHRALHAPRADDAVDNARTGLIAVCRQVARVLLVVSLRAVSAADRVASAQASRHAERLAVTLRPGPAQLTPRRAVKACSPAGGQSMTSGAPPCA